MSKFKALVHLVCGETPLPGPQMSSRWVFTCGRGEGPPRGLFHKDADPIMGAAPSRPNDLPQTPPAGTVALGVRRSTHRGHNLPNSRDSPGLAVQGAARIRLLSGTLPPTSPHKSSCLAGGMCVDVCNTGVVGKTWPRPHSSPECPERARAGRRLPARWKDAAETGPERTPGCYCA